MAENDVGRPADEDDEAGVSGRGVRNDDSEWLVDGEAAYVDVIDDVWPAMGVMGEESDDGMWVLELVVGRKRMPSRVRIESLLGSSLTPLPSSSISTRADETFGQPSPSLLAPGSFSDGIESVEVAAGDVGE
jgi:hypothetical protein